jgi:5-(aminomethyl)-3-furanmethanol phosphate kinase
MWIVKLGGSLNPDPLLKAWLDLFEQIGGGRVTVVCGGGTFADEVRRAQAQWRFDDLPAHNMAVLAMAQSAYLAKGINPRLEIAGSAAAIRRVLRGGRTALWMPMEWLHDQPHPNANWDFTADSMALDLACKLNAERVVVVKSCPIEVGTTWADLAAGDVLDKRFASLAREAAFPIDVVDRHALPRVRDMLLGVAHPAGTA